MTSSFGPGDGVRLHYLREGGGGPPVLLLHGWPGFCYDWRYVIPEVARFADVIAPDLRGFGFSDAPEAAVEYQPERFAADIIALLRALGLSQVTLAAYDIGATVAQRIALTAPELVSSLVLAAPPYGGIGMRRFEPAVQGEFWYQHFHRIPFAPDIVAYDRNTVKLYIKHFYDHWSGNGYVLADDELEAIGDVYARPGRFAASIQWYRARGKSRLNEAVQADHAVIGQPARILWGALDPVMRVEWSDRLAEYFADHTLQVLDGVGHFVPLEARDAFTDSIKMLLP